MTNPIEMARRCRLRPRAIPVAFGAQVLGSFIRAERNLDRFGLDQLLSQHRAASRTVIAHIARRQGDDKFG